MFKAKSEKEITDAIKGRAVLDFTANWCGPCAAMKTLLVKAEKGLLSNEKYRANPIRFVSIDVDAFSDFSEECQVGSIPTLLFIKNGKEISRVNGLVKFETVMKHIERLI